jgi:hypothetical protein
VRVRTVISIPQWYFAILYFDVKLHGVLKIKMFLIIDPMPPMQGGTIGK